MPWAKLKRMSLLLAWIGLTSCSHGPEPFICDVQPAYTETGADDLTAYRVNRTCLRGVTARLNACYKE